MHEETIAPTPGDSIVRALLSAEMDDGTPISTTVKVDTMLDHLEIKNPPIELKRLLARGINTTLKLRRRGRGRAPIIQLLDD